jgi:hypothetical protein
MEGAKKEITENKQKNVTLIGKCGKCGKTFEAEAVLPLIKYYDNEGNSFKGLASPHFVVNCPYCFALLNLALRAETGRRWRYG